MHKLCSLLTASELQTWHCRGPTGIQTQRARLGSTKRKSKCASAACKCLLIADTQGAKGKLSGNSSDLKLAEYTECMCLITSAHSEPGLHSRSKVSQVILEMMQRILKAGTVNQEQPQSIEVVL